MRVRRVSLNRLLMFQQRGPGDDGFGNKVGDFQDRFQEPAGLMYRRGGEQELAARLQARQPVVLTINRNSRTETIRANWRAVMGSTQFDIKENPTQTDDGRYLQMLAEATDIASF